MNGNYVTIIDTYEDGVQVFPFETYEEAHSYGFHCEFDNCGDYIGVCSMAIYTALRDSFKEV